MRKLASIEVVWYTEPIEGADRIELVHVLGWQCIAPKGQFHKGDWCVYFEIDSFLPIRPEFEFLRAGSYTHSDFLGEGFRIKTRRMRGQLSQGLVMPIQAFDELAGRYMKVGMDVSDLLGVRKWEIEEKATTGGTVIGTLPPGVPHTDETRFQAMPALLDAFVGEPYYITTKMDGSSHSLAIDENGFHVCGHNYEYKDDGKCSFYEFVNRRGYREAMERFMKERGIRTLTIQGEFCAPGIQSNRLKLKNPEWYVFTVMIDGERVGLNKMTFAVGEMGMEMVPLEEVGVDLPHHYPTVEAVLERAEGCYPNGGQKEGIVVRTIEPKYCAVIGAPLSMKVINNRYLLKEG